MKNVELLRGVLDDVRFSGQHDQSIWIQKNDCGTACCVAGFAVLRVGAEPIWYYDDAALVEYQGRRHHVSDLAREVLGLTEDEADELFNGNNSTERVIELLEGHIKAAEAATR